MVEDSVALDRVFGAMSDPTRRALLARLAEGEASVSELSEPHAMSLAAVSKHLHVLERAGLMTQRRSGRIRYCRLAPAPLRRADDWLSDYRRFWEVRMDALVEHFKP
jgi:DNA-binding transcriptional ArsR family regulator